MIMIALNHLSLDKHYRTYGEFECAFKELVESIEHILPAIRSDRMRVFYDEMLEIRSCMMTEDSFAKAVSQIADRDLKQKWFLYSRNQFRIAEGIDFTFTIVGNTPGEVYENLVRTEFLQEGIIWMSLKGSPHFPGGALQLNVNDENVMLLQNSISRSQFILLLPIFEASPKHKKKGYYNIKGQYVSPLTLSKQVCQEALLVSFEKEGARFAKVSGKFLRFVKTHPGRLIYHAFEVTEADFPTER